MFYKSYKTHKKYKRLHKYKRRALYFSKINLCANDPTVVHRSRTTPSLSISYNGGTTNNNLLKFYERQTTQLANFRTWLSDNLNVLSSTPSTITSYVDYRFYNNLDSSGRNNTLTQTGTGTVFTTTGGPREGDAFLNIPTGNTLSTNIAPTTEHITVANAAGGTGMIMSFDIKLNNTTTLDVKKDHWLSQSSYLTTIDSTAF
jgi:hypothetical protein